MYPEVEMSGFFGDSVVSCDVFLETILWEDVFAEIDTWEDVLLRTDMWWFSGGMWYFARVDAWENAWYLEGI